MSTANDIEPTSESPAPETAETPVEQIVIPSDADAAVDQLRALVCGLVVGLLLSSMAFTIFIFKEVRILKYQIASRQSQLEQTQKFLQMALPTVNELAKYSVGKPELQPIFGRYGMKMKQDVAPAPQSGFQPMP